MCNFQEMFLKGEMPFFVPSSSLLARMHMMAGPQAATLGHEIETKC